MTSIRALKSSLLVGAALLVQAASAEVPRAPEDGGPRAFEVTAAGGLNLRAQPDTGAPVLATFGAGTVLDNLGCLETGGRAWCDVQRLGGGPRGFVAAEFIQPQIAPHGAVATGPDDSASRAGQGEFDATGELPCAWASGQPSRPCRFGVARAGGGYATVVVEFGDNRKRAIYFRAGIPVGADTGQADGYPEFSARKEMDLHLIQVGQERYEITDAVIFGG